MLKDLQKNDVPTGRNTMKPYLKEIATFVPAILLAAVLAACGGGGGDSNSEPPLTYQSLVTTVPAVDYASAVSSADVLAMASQVAAIRQGAGAGLLAQNTHLDTAAGKHAAYLVDNDGQVSGVYLTSSHNGIMGGHYEDSNAATYSQTYYSGASPQARATAAGYAGTVTELMVFGTASGAECLASLENSVYHSIALVSPFIDLGIGFDPGAAGVPPVCAIEMGVSSTTLGQLPDTAPVAYPYAGQTDVLPTFSPVGEVPNPTPSLASAGHPVVVSLYTMGNQSLSGGDIAIHTFSITPRTGPSAGQALTVQVLANTGVTSDGPALTVDNVLPGAGFVVLVPSAPLEAHTDYNLSFNAMVKGTSVTKTWTFTTGALN